MAGALGWKMGSARKSRPCAPIKTSPADKIKVRAYPVREDGNLIWVYIAADKRYDGTPNNRPAALPYGR